MTLTTASLDRASRLARLELASAYRRLFPEGGADVSFEGHLLRPILSLVGASARARTDERFWYAALAVQLAHEASLVHDDVVDQAAVRRERPTTVAKAGVAAALLEGDLLLTAAYVSAAATGCGEFTSHFARAVSRTVAAERAQGSWIGRPVARAVLEQIASGKAGELMGCALVAASLIDGARDEEAARLGERIGVLYQMMDDLLDYCPSFQAGKPALGDYTQARWTWPLDHVPGAQLGLPTTEILAQLHECGRGGAGRSPMAEAVECLQQSIARVMRDCAAHFPHDRLLADLLEGWKATVAEAFELETTSRATAARAALTARLSVVDAHSGEMGYMAHNSRSFRFASRLLPRELAQRIARVYAFCRFTDDLADTPASTGVSRGELIEEWARLAAASYSGYPVALPVLDRTMREMREAGVPFNIVSDLCRGMRMDIGGTTYATLAELRLYTYRVAGVVGLWIARLAGVRDSVALANAERMGHAMQLTNILRDVGEDWRNGRLYLPLDMLAHYGLAREDIGAMVEGTARVTDAYREMMKKLVRLAHSDYEAAFAWLPSLPTPLQPGMAVAAELYESIHDALRRNDYDNLNQRATTSLARKFGVAGHALRSLRAARRVNLPQHAIMPDTPFLDHGLEA